MGLAHACARHCSRPLTHSDSPRRLGLGQPWGAGGGGAGGGSDKEAEAEKLPRGTEARPSASGSLRPQPLCPGLPETGTLPETRVGKRHDPRLQRSTGLELRGGNGDFQEGRWGSKAL